MNKFDDFSTEPNTCDGRSEPPSRRKKADKGLPDEAARQELARTFLTLQRRLWPEVVKAGILPSPSPKVLVRMADQFRERFQGHDAPTVQSPPGTGRWKELGVAYLRYSCENSNPRSLDQQLKNILERAVRDGVFIPWEGVFADASVSGMIAVRQGYLLAKGAMKVKGSGPGRLYVDEMGRASRDLIEALRLGKLVENLRKRMIGVTDGFDSDLPNSKIMLTIFGVLNEVFLDQLRAKVRRGMADGFSRGRNLGKPAVGYKLVPMTGPDGRVVTDDGGRTLMVKAIDEAEVEHVLEGFRLFADGKQSTSRVGKRFNELKVGGIDTWDSTPIRQLLTRETYFGVEYYGMTYRVVDPETGDITIVRRPKAEWKRREVPHLRIVPPDLEARTKARQKECREAYLKRSGDGKTGPGRGAVYPTVLVRPVCGYCTCDLSLGRSGKYASFCCPNGSGGKKGCGLQTYKTVRIVEDAVVNHIKQAVVTHEFVAALVDRANAYLRTESRRPKGDTKRIQTEIGKVTDRQQWLLKVDEAGGGDVVVVAAELKKCDARLAELRGRLREIEGLAEPLVPITTVQVEALVADLHALLREDVAVVAPILRELTGPVAVTQEAQAGKRGAVWIARFAVNLVPVLAHLTRRRGCPTTGTWEYLHTRGWTTPIRCEIPIGYVPKHESLAPVVKKMVDDGAILPDIATTLGESYDTVRCALIFAHSGERPKSQPAGQRTGGRSRPPKYITLAPEVARLRDEEHTPFAHIAKRLEISKPTVRQAYDYAHKGQVRAAAKNGQPFQRGRYVRLDHATRCDIRERLGRGESAAFIASAVGCSAGTVRRIGREE